MPIVSKSKNYKQYTLCYEAWHGNATANFYLQTSTARILGYSGDGQYIKLMHAVPFEAATMREAKECAQDLCMSGTGVFEVKDITGRIMFTDKDYA